MRKVHLSNAEGRNTTVAFAALSPPPPPPSGTVSGPAVFRRYLAATPENQHEALAARFGPVYGKALIEGDPEVDAELIGRTIGETSMVLLAHDGEVLYAPPQLVEIILGPDGAERERRKPVDVEANVAEDQPIRWTKTRFKRADLVRRFAVARTLQIRHVDGVTCDYLHGMAKDLDAADEVVLIGAGEKGRDPLVLQLNGNPWRAFLEGRVDGNRYQLLLHLSNLELKRPAERSAAGGSA